MAPPPETPVRKITHKFDWPLTRKLTMEHATALRLVKGVLMREGQLKSGQHMTAENVIFGSGAMRAACILKHAVIDPDHIKKGPLPPVYQSKYGAPPGENAVPSGYLIDAQHVKAEHDGKMELQALMMVDEWLYKAIKENKVVGNSVSDSFRKVVCDGGRCEFEGSAYMRNSLMLEEVPNCDGTWVNAVSEEDIGTIITADDRPAEHSEQSPLVQYMEERLHAAGATAAAENAATDYMTADGKWASPEAAVTYLRTEKHMDAALAQPVGEYLVAHPDQLNARQAQFLSKPDLMAWWTHARLHAMETRMQEHGDGGGSSSSSAEESKPAEPAAAAGEAAATEPAADAQKQEGDTPAAADPPATDDTTKNDSSESGEGSGDANAGKPAENAAATPCSCQQNSAAATATDKIKSHVAQPGEHAVSTGRTTQDNMTRIHEINIQIAALDRLENNIHSLPDPSSPDAAFTRRSILNAVEEELTYAYDRIRGLQMDMQNEAATPSKVATAIVN